MAAATAFIIATVLFFIIPLSVNPYKLTFEQDDSCPLMNPNDGDGDGIPNIWELIGVDINNDGLIDLHLPESNPLRKDIYVHVDYMGNHAPYTVAIDRVISSFADAPVCNPDGTTGIDLHVEIDEEIPHKNFTSISELLNIKQTSFGTSSERSDPNSVNIIDAKMLIYYYSVFAHDQYRHDSGSSGRADGIPGKNFMITLGGCRNPPNCAWAIDPSTGHRTGNVEQQAGTFMHELGHSLGLYHSGAQDSSIDNNYKPNYLSVMNYAFQFPSLVPDRPLDYSRCSIPSLNESNLSEPEGIGPSCPANLPTITYDMSPDGTCYPDPVTITGFAINWNKDDDTTPVDENVRRDTNPWQGRNFCDIIINNELTGHDDWTNLKYLSIGDDTAGVNNATEAFMEEDEEELTDQDIIDQRFLLLEGIKQDIQNVPDAAINISSMASIIGANETARISENVTAAAEIGRSFLTDTIIGVSNATNATNAGVNNATITDLLATNQLDKAIEKLDELQSTMDSFLGGSSANDIISDLGAQQDIFIRIENLKEVLRKQLPEQIPKPNENITN
jgi:hypothetical protein